MSRSDRRIASPASGGHEDTTLSLGMVPALTPSAQRGAASGHNASVSADGTPGAEWRTPDSCRMSSAGHEDGTRTTSSYGSYSSRGGDEGYGTDRRSTWDAGMLGHGGEPVMHHMHARARATSALSEMQPLERLGAMRSLSGSGGSYTYSQLSCSSHSEAAMANNSSSGSPADGWSGGETREHHSANTHSAYHQYGFHRSANHQGHFPPEASDMLTGAGRQDVGRSSSADAVTADRLDGPSCPPCDKLATHRSDPTSTSSSSSAPSASGTSPSHNLPLHRQYAQAGTNSRSMERAGSDPQTASCTRESPPSPSSPAGWPSPTFLRAPSQPPLSAAVPRAPVLDLPGSPGRGSGAQAGGAAAAGAAASASTCAAAAAGSDAGGTAGVAGVSGPRGEAFFPLSSSYAFGGEEGSSAHATASCTAAAASSSSGRCKQAEHLEGGDPTDTAGAHCAGRDDGGGDSVCLPGREDEGASEGVAYPALTLTPLVSATTSRGASGATGTSRGLTELERGDLQQGSSWANVLRRRSVTAVTAGRPPSSLLRATTVSHRRDQRAAPVPSPTPPQYLAPLPHSGTRNPVRQGGMFPSPSSPYPQGLQKSGGSVCLPSSPYQTFNPPASPPRSNSHSATFSLRKLPSDAATVLSPSRSRTSAIVRQGSGWFKMYPGSGTSPMKVGVAVGGGGVSVAIGGSVRLKSRLSGDSIEEERAADDKSGSLSAKERTHLGREGRQEHLSSGVRAERSAGGLRRTGSGQEGSGGLRVLVADDSAVNQKVAVRFLRKKGLTAEAVGDGAEALIKLYPKSHKLTGARYDLLLLDVQVRGSIARTVLDGCSLGSDAFLSVQQVVAAVSSVECMTSQLRRASTCRAAILRLL